MMDYYKANIPETEAVVDKDSDYCTIFFLVTTVSLSCLYTWWLTLAFLPVYHVSLTSGYCITTSLSLPIFARSFLFVIMICGRGVGGWAGRRTSCLFALACAAALSFLSSLCLHAHGAVERCWGWRGRLLWTLCICLRFMTMIWNDNDYLSERMRDLAEIDDV